MLKLLKDNILCLAVLVMLFSVSVIAQAHQEETSGIVPGKDLLTPAQRSWLAEHPVIRLGMEPNFQPLIVEDDQGNYNGILKELIDELNRVLQTNIIIDYGNWSDQVQKARKRELDGLLSVAPAQVRASKLLGTQVTHFEVPMVYVRKDSKLKINSLDDLKGLRLAVQDEIECLHVLIRPYDQYKEFYATKTSLEALNMLTEGKVDAVLAQNYEEFLLASHLITNIKVAFSDIKNPTPTVIGIRDDWPELVEIINTGLNAIGRENIAKYYSKWMSSYRDISDIVVTEEENIWLSANPVLKVWLPDNMPPYSHTSKGVRQGLICDYLKVMGKYLNIQLVPVYGDKSQADIICSFSGNRPDDTYLLTKYFFQASQVIITGNDVPFVPDVIWLSGKKVVVLAGSKMEKYLSEFSSLELSSAASVKEALEMLSADMVDAFVGEAVSSSYIIISNGMPGLKIAASTNYTEDLLALAVPAQEKTMLSVLNKAISAITLQEHDAILAQWMSVRYEQVADWKHLWKMILLFTAIPGGGLILVIFWNRQLGLAVAMRTDELNQYKEHLEVLVEQRTDELGLRNKELEQAMARLKQTQGQLILYEKLGALRHLVAGIAHEINSPLGAINTSREILAVNLRRIIDNVNYIAQALSGPHSQIVADIIAKCCKDAQQNTTLTSREKRALRAEIIGILEKNDIPNSEEVARLLVELKAHENYEGYVPLLKEKDAMELLNVMLSIVDAFVSCDTIELAVKKASKIILALNNYIRKGASNEDGSVMKEKVDIKFNLENILTLFYNAIKYSIRLEVDYEEDLPLIDGYPDELNQVWTNLLQNAIDAMNRSGKLGVKACRKDNGVLVEISDDGCGMTQEVKSRLFEPLFTTKGAGEGLGLGMDIVHRIVVENHGGKIDVASEPGKGTTISVWLPA
ncbi:MAG: transporter substrate-binding domain-containing protein [Sedimentisphaerales bacterium]|nr:transporter substrate-binding domain-containing protein [Sedimentisphaerales bacterium]MBN2841489.1 transporter substrate-binding domain-containing protein [Sedimentisphaerales bacterium]